MFTHNRILNILFYFNYKTSSRKYPYCFYLIVHPRGPIECNRPHHRLGGGSRVVLPKHEHYQRADCVSFSSNSDGSCRDYSINTLQYKMPRAGGAELSAYLGGTATIMYITWY